MKLILWLVLGLLVLLALRSKSKAAQNPTSTKVERDGQGQAKEVELMLCCSACGVYFPASEAIMQDDKVFCCREHRDRHAPKA